MKKALYMILFAALSTLCVFMVSGAEAETGNGYLTFKPYGVYKTENSLDAVPLTYEAWVRVPKQKNAASGIILGNNLGECYSSFQFHIYNNSAPMIKFINKVPDGQYRQTTCTFTKATVATGKWTHVAIAVDTAKSQLHCYINGELAETQSFNFPLDPCPLPLVLGGDNRSGNTGYFKGQLRSATLYSDVRTPAEIKADMNAADLNDACLMAHYDLTKAEFGRDIADAAGHYDMLYDPYWYDNAEAPSDYAYSMAVIGDQQIISINYPSDLHRIYDWILANKAGKKIEYVLALGDITNERDNATEWALVAQQFDRLSGILPMAICRGNHDYSAPFNKYLNFNGYMSDIVGRYAEKIDNHYKLKKIGNTDYLFMVLDYGPDDAALAWACSVVEQYPDHKVIVITHSYMADDGTTTDQYDPVAPTTNSGHNNGDDIWEKFVRKYENIVLVLSGHIDSHQIRATKAVGDHGNVVTQMLINPQGIDVYTPSGMLCMLYFNEEGNIMTTDCYSTIRNRYFNIAENRYTIFVGEGSGDCNGDGKIDGADADAALSAALAREYVKRADVDGDGKVTLSDVLEITRASREGESQ